MPLTALNAADDLLQRAELLAERAEVPPVDQWSVESDILRASWTFVGASLDTYFHERVRRALLMMPMSKAAQGYLVPLGPIEEMVGAFLDNRTTSRPRVRLMKIVQEALLKDTFQGARNIERAFNLLGVAKCWSALSASMNESPQAIRERLNRQYARRNQITHEGDYKPQERPQHLYCRKIKRSDVDGEIKWTRTFLHAADAL
ncbi:hypothetical protein [Micromonospora trifolii]|uniref:hypothetical protein n=1 Tax=Micromonospora trifolii TaxID=2911208 RepID=UPI003CEC781D